MLPGTLRIDNARLPNIAETDELYVVPGDQGKKARVYPDVLSYYQNNMKNTLMEVSLP